METQRQKAELAKERFKSVLSTSEEHGELTVLSKAGWVERWPWLFTHADFPGISIEWGSVGTGFKNIRIGFRENEKFETIWETL